MHFLLLFIKMPVKIVEKLEAYRVFFSKRVAICDKRIYWVKWSNVLASKQVGGLGIGSLLAINKSLF